MSNVHVIGAGLAGLSASIALADAGQAVILYEAGPAAGGRCRSYFDRELDLRIDNGNHLLLTGNRDTFAYVKAIGAEEQLTGPAEPTFPFVDLNSGERWTVRPNLGRFPWWIFVANRSVPDARLSDYRYLLSIARTRDDTVVLDAMRRGRLYWRLIEPLAIAALNTRPQVGLARLLGSVMRETLMRGGAACIPRYPREGLSEALVDPALHALRSRGTAVHFNRRVTAIHSAGERVVGLDTAEGTVAVSPGDAVILAVPPWIAGALLPLLTVPDQSEAILNVHFRMTINPASNLTEAGFIGIIGGTAEWVFIKPGHVSVTISAANALVDDAAGALANLVWPNVRSALAIPYDVPLTIPPFRVVKERRATFAATAAQDRRRPPTRTPFANLMLAGDWTATGLPATIEGAIRSGHAAADALLSA
jgi:hydroxysqualene dehydroxylase